MKQRIDSQLFRGVVNKDLNVNFMYTFTDEGNFQTIVEREGAVKIQQSFLLGISEGYGRPFITVQSNVYPSFISLLDKSIKLISENLYDIYPDIGKIEFDIDSKTMEIYQTEKAIQTAGMIMVPDVWIDMSQQCFPAIKMTSTKYPMGVKIPLEDAVAMSKMLSCFDPNVYGLTLLRILGKIE